MSRARNRPLPPAIFGRTCWNRTNDLSLIRGSRYQLSQRPTMDGEEGIEPSHHGVKFHCLTTWLHPNMATREGIEPSTVRLTVGYSTTELPRNSAEKRTRTSDRHLTHLEHQQPPYHLAISAWWEVMESNHPIRRNWFTASPATTYGITSHIVLP